MARHVICPLDEDLLCEASTATASAARLAHEARLAPAIARAWCFCRMWAISWAITPASSLSFWERMKSPVWMPMWPPTSAKALCT